MLELRRSLVETNERYWHEYGDVVRVLLGPPGVGREAWIVSHPDAAARVLGGSTWRDFTKNDAVYEELRYWLGGGILAVQGDEWTRQKRLFQPLFTKAAVEGYAAAMTREIEESIAGWTTDGGVQAVDLGARMTALTVRVVGRVLFGESFEEAIPRVQPAFPPVSTVIARRGLAGVRLPPGIPTPLVREARAGQAELYAVCDEIVARRRAEGTPAGGDLLGRLLAVRDEGAGLSDAEIREQILVFLLAGHETTATALTFALHLLGRHADIQEAVRAEVSTVSSDPPTASDTHRMPLTLAVLKEAMRLYPSVPTLARFTAADDELLGYPIRAGVAVGVSIRNIQRRPDLWPDPLRFDPTRFLPEAEAREERHRYAWMPFGGGPRACIGQHFSLLEATLALAMIVRRYRMTALAAGDHLPVNSALTLFPLAPVRSAVRAL